MDAQGNIVGGGAEPQRLHCYASHNTPGILRGGMDPWGTVANFSFEADLVVVETRAGIIENSS